MKPHLRALILAVAVGALLVAAEGSTQSPPAKRVALLVDNGFLVGNSINSMRAALQAFVDGLPAQDEIMLATIAGPFHLRQAPTTDRKKLKDAIGLIFVEGSGTQLVSSVMEADNRFVKPAKDRAGVIVVVTTDGPETSGDKIAEYNKWLRDVIARQVVAHAIVLTHTEGQGNELQICMSLTKSTGGRYESITTATTLPDKLKAIASVIAENR
ncbi:MAG TPA: vWA domain-containing protein [Vicinamibacterales bacterium]|nr:vWA domain-containing protein [Vicinamibacterales bacterium]